MALVPLQRENDGVTRPTPFGNQGDEFGGDNVQGITRPTPFSAGGEDGVQIFRGSGFGRAGTGRPRIRRPQSSGNASKSSTLLRGPSDPAFSSFKEGFDFGAPKGVFNTPRGTFTSGKRSRRFTSFG